MCSSRKILCSLLALIALIVMASTASAADPGLPVPVSREPSDQRPGSILVYNIYTSSPTTPNTSNTRICITNTNPSVGVTVHLFFVDGATCSVADAIICLTANQVACFLASDVDPGVTGYVVAVAVDSLGRPISHNFLTGNLFCKFPFPPAGEGPDNFEGNFGAVTFQALFTGVAPGTNETSSSATLTFDGLKGYSRVPRVLAVDQIGSPVAPDGERTMLVINRVGGNLATNVASIGSVFGVLFNDAENAFSFTFSSSTCQFRPILSNVFPRTTPRLDVVIPAGRNGWMKFWSTSDIGLLGSVFVVSLQGDDAAPNAFDGGRNLYYLTFTTAATLTIPVFPSGC